MKSLLFNYSDVTGGAARAAYRIHHAVRAAGIDSRMQVSQALSGDSTVQRLKAKWINGESILRPLIGQVATRLLKTGNPISHSPAILPSRWLKRINTSEVDVVHLHWVNYEMMSISDLGRIRKPVVWTLHDMWAFCGAEHYTEDFRWRDGYTSHNRPDYEQGFDLNRWTWRRKQRAWRRPMHIVAPSRWLADCAKESRLMRDWPIYVVPNAIDTEAWQPVDKVIARQLLKVPVDAQLLLFGAIGGSVDPRKGFDLLQSALSHLRGELPDLELIVFGQFQPKEPHQLGFPVHYTGHLHDDVSLRLLYSAADALVIPSRQDNLPNTGVEAMSCGTPVVAFDACGLPDIVRHQQTGYLAEPFEVEDLAQGIHWLLTDKERLTRLSANAREDAVGRFSYPVCGSAYRRVYEEAVALS